MVLTGDYWDPFGGPLPSKTPTSAEVLRPSAGELHEAPNSRFPHSQYQLLVQLGQMHRLGGTNQ